VHAGTYDGIVRITRSGRPDAPIVLMGAGDGPARITATLPPLGCDGTAPSDDRTLQIVNGADDWTIRDLAVVGGILVRGDFAQRKLADPMNRELPGRGARPDSAASERLLDQLGVNATDRIRLLDLDLSGRGFYAVASRHGQLLDSHVHDLDCGVGAAVLLARYSDFWTVRGNDVRNMAASAKHWMSEGIRLGASSSYNLIEDNVVEHMNGPGRGITADVGSSWNVFRNNRVSDTAVNYSEQLGGWGNQYVFNTSSDARNVGFMVYEKGNKDSGPASGTPRFLLFQCNDSRNDPVAFRAGGLSDSAVLDNNFPRAQLGGNLRRYWSSAQNQWKGNASAPAGVEAEGGSGFSSCAGRRPAG
jgi:hypothetical protein